MSLQHNSLGKEQKGLKQYLKSNKKTIKKIITKWGIITLLIANIKVILNPYPYYELVTGQIDSQIISEDNKRIVELFQDTVSELPTEWLTNFNNNLQNIKMYNVYTDIRLFTNKGVLAYYDPNNRIIVRDENNDKRNSVVLHELLHMASNDGNTIGFCSSNITFNNIGSGINEGYTNHLMSSLFGIDNTAYEVEMLCAKMLDSIIGTEKMMEYYFTSNHEGLINDISMVYQQGNEILYGKKDKEKAINDAVELIKLIDLYQDYNKLNNIGEVIKLREKLADKLYNLAIYNRLYKNNIYINENHELVYTVFLEDDIMINAEKLNPNGFYHIGVDNSFNDVHTIVVDTNFSAEITESPKEVMDRLNNIKKR